VILFCDTSAVLKLFVLEAHRDAAALAQARQAWVASRPDFVVVEVDQPLVELAVDYAEAFALRAYDSMRATACGSRVSTDAW
jgi:predicted nucleic acid-binding protein